MREKLQKEIISALKNKDKEKLSTLKVFKGEIERIESGASERLTESEISTVAGKLIKSIKLVNGSEREIEILSEYAPKTLSDIELEVLCVDLLTEVGDRTMKGAGLVMKILAERYTGQYDGKVAMTIIKNVING